MYSDWSVLAELLLGFVHLSDEIDEALSGFWHPLLWPVGELELADCSGLAILGDQREQVFSCTEEWLLGLMEGWRDGGTDLSKDKSPLRVYCDVDEEATRLLSRQP